MIYLGTFGLDDPIRENVRETINTIKYGDPNGEKAQDGNHANVRMVTGDHLSTAIQVALKTGIVRSDELSIKRVAMTGKQFREEIGRYKKVWDEDRQEYRIDFTDYESFKEVKNSMKILARATAEDKFVFVAGIKQKGGLIAMTGDSIGDAEAL